MELLTEGRDGFITIQDIESAMYSFPLFCTDNLTNEDPEVSCAKDIAGFFFFILAKDIVDAAQSPSDVTEYWQTALQNVYDEECYYTWNDYIEYGVSEVAAGRKTPAQCANWGKAANDAFKQFPEYKEAAYYEVGGGPMPLRGSADYGTFSQVVLGNKFELLENPEYATDSRLLAAIPMWRYMSYSSNAPSFHDIVTGHWTPDKAETDSGLKATETINAIFSVFQHATGQTVACGSVPELTSRFAGQEFSLGDAYNEIRDILGVDFNTSEDITCKDVQVYPTTGGPNAGYFLKWDSSSKQCVLTSDRTSYHAFRSGDMRHCIADHQFGGEFRQAYDAIKNAVIRFTVYKANYPYVLGDYASPPTNTSTAYKCLKPLACAKTVPGATGSSAIWGTKETSIVVQFYDPALIIDPEVIDCILFNSIKTANANALDAKFFDLKDPDTVYVCDGAPLRVFSCLTTESACLGAQPSDANLTQTAPIWLVHKAIGRDANAKASELYCAEDGRFDYEGDAKGANALAWSYDFSTFEFMGGEVCTYDKDLYMQVKSGFVFPTRTVTGLTADQLALIATVTADNTTNTKQSVWTAFKVSYDAAIATITGNTTTVTIHGTTYTKAQLMNIRYTGNKEGRLHLWEHAEAVPTTTTTTTGARRVLRRLVLTTTCTDLDDFGIDLAYYFNTKQYTPEMIAAIVKDSKTEYGDAVAITNASAANMRDAGRTTTGFLDADIGYLSLSGDNAAA